MISALQRRIAILFAALPESEGFALGGGAALIVHEQVRRDTRDLDFFTTEPGGLRVLMPALESALSKEGLDVRCLRQSETFARFEVTDGTETTEVDLATDARMLPIEVTDLGAVLSMEELAADKTLALFDRAQPRDFVDFLALEERFGLERLCELAAEKDPGFRPSILAESLKGFYRLPRNEFDSTDTDFERLARAVERWTDALNKTEFTDG